MLSSCCIMILANYKVAKHLGVFLTQILKGLAYMLDLI